MKCQISLSANDYEVTYTCRVISFQTYVIQSDSISRGHKLLSIKNYVIEIMT